MVNKKTLTFIIITLSILLIGMLNVLAEEHYQYGDFYYTVTDGEATIAGCHVHMETTVEVPDSIGGYPVTGIGSEAFHGCFELKEIILPESIKNIEFKAFEMCDNLVEINIPVRNKYYTVYDGVLYNKDKTLLHTYFKGNSRTQYTVEDSVTVIGDYAFNSCYNLSEILLPDGLEVIGDEAFSGIGSLTAITIPASVREIGEGAFGGCGKLTGINVAEENQYYASLDGALYDKDLSTLYIYMKAKNETSCTLPDTLKTITSYAFQGCTALKEVNVPETLRYIGDYAFYYCTGLTEINIPDSVTYIGEFAFFNCSQLTEINIPDGIEVISGRAFAECEQIKSVEIPDSVKEIGDYAFKGCQITAVDIPYGVTTIGDCAFAYCPNLTSITIPDSVTDLGRYVIEETPCLLNSPRENGLLYIGRHLMEADDDFTGHCTVKEGTITIAGDAFSLSKNLTGITIPDSVVNIGEHAFWNCSSMKDVNIPEGITNIGAYTFYGCQNLTKLIVPDSVNYIGGYAFWQCYKLSEINIPGGVTYIGDHAFNYCNTLSTVYYNGNLKDWDKIEIGTGNSGIISVGKKYFYYVTLLDAEGNEISRKKQAPGEIIDLSMVDVLDSTLLELYTDKELTHKYDVDTPVNENLVLYVNVGQKNRIMIHGDTEVEVGTEGIVQAVSFSTDKDASVLYCSVVYPEDLILKAVNARDFKYVEKGEEYTESGCTTVTVFCQYSDTALIPKNVNITPFELVFDVSPDAVSEEAQLMITEETFLTGNDVYFFESRIPNDLKLVRRLVESIEVIGNDVVLGSTVYIAKVLPTNAVNREVEWTVSDSTVATIDINGTVTPLSGGTVTIKATATDGSGVYGEKTITVIKIVESIEIVGPGYISEATAYAAQVLPEDATYKEVRWSISDDKIAVIDQNGVVVPVTSGTVIITATATDGSGVYSSTAIEIIKYAESIDIVGAAEISEPTQYSVVILPEYTTNKNAEWFVSDESVATVDENGFVTPLKNGRIVLTAKAEDASGVETTKSIIVTVSVRATITASIGVWDKEFNSDLTEYTIIVPSGTDSIKLTPNFKDATAKINGSIAPNGFSKSVKLPDEITKIEVVLTPWAGNPLKANTYTITVIKSEGTETTVSEDGRAFSVKTFNIERGKYIILALYENGKLVKMMSEINGGKEILFETSVKYDDAKVMVWEDMITMKPLCEPENVK